MLWSDAICLGCKDEETYSEGGKMLEITRQVKALGLLVGGPQSQQREE